MMGDQSVSRSVSRSVSQSVANDECGEMSDDAMRCDEV